MFMKGMNTKVFIPTNLSEFYNTEKLHFTESRLSEVQSYFSVLPLSDVLISTDKITKGISDKHGLGYSKLEYNISEKSRNIYM